MLVLLVRTIGPKYGGETSLFVATTTDTYEPANVVSDVARELEYTFCPLHPRRDIFVSVLHSKLA